MHKGDTRGIIFDIDGVLEFQGKVCPGAVETVDVLRDKGTVLRFLTNSTLKSRESCAARLRRAGFRIFDKEVITASYATAVYLEELEPRSCWIMLEGEGLDEFKRFAQDTENPEYIVIGDNRSQFDFEHLSRALRALLKGARLIGMQPELIDKSIGETTLNVGSWVEMLARASDTQATYVGKPSPFVFELALRTMDLDKSQVIMVGDQVATDIQGARNFGIRSALLRTGEFRAGELDGSFKPDYEFGSIRDVLTIL